MASGSSAFSAYHGPASGSPFTVTALGRWSSVNKQLPALENIKSLHVYDFDNTLFNTPLPNTALWNGPTVAMLSSQDIFVNGGWWHDNRILSSAGEGVEKEEKRGWEGWWNENMVELVRLSIKQPDALCVLLTGRSEHGFAELVKKMVASKGLDFDIVGLKPRVSPNNQTFQSTMHFKQLFLSSLMETYRKATEIKVYEDRPKHTKGFRDFFAEFNRRQLAFPTRGTINADVTQVWASSTKLDPVVEVAEVQHMINLHNDAMDSSQPLRPEAGHEKLRIKKTVFFTSYVINPTDTKRLINLAQIPTNVPGHDLKFHGNNIVICPRPCPASILDKVGGMGNTMTWEVTGTACYENSIWAACLRPVPATAKYHTDNPMPLVVLALRKGARPIDAGKITDWTPLPQEKTFTLTTTVSEKVILRIGADDPREDEYESLFANKSSKRKHAGDDSAAPRKGFGQRGGRTEARAYHSSAGRGHPGQGRGRGGRGHRNASRGNGRGGRGRGAGFNYRSLDDPSKNVAAHASGGAPGRPMGGPGPNNADLQNYY